LVVLALTALGLIGTGAHQAGFFDIESEPTSVVCAHDNVEVGDVKGTSLISIILCHFVVNGLITVFSILNARFANCLPSRPYSFNITRVSGNIDKKG
jgi:hypothetical protein